MGIRTVLSYKDCCEFEANNCLPVTWLSLFSPQDFVLETRQEDGEDFQVAIFRTNRENALRQVDQVISALNGQTPAWPYLRPIEILKAELISSPCEGLVELDLTQFWQMGKEYQQKMLAAVSEFQKMLGYFNRYSDNDISILNQLVNKYSLENIASINILSPEDLMFTFFGTYWGDPEREELHSIDYFNDDYWKNAS